MTMLFIEGFDIGALAYTWDNSSAQPTPNTSYGRLSTKGVRVGDTPNDYLYKQFTNTNDTIIIGWAAKFVLVGAATDELVMDVYEGGTKQGGLRLDLDGSVKYCLGTSSTAISGASAGAGSITLNTWVYLELKVKISNTVGTVELRQNGVTIFSTTGQDTQNTSNAYVNRVTFGNTVGGWVHDWYLDDVYIFNGAGSVNNDFAGDVKVVASFPDGNGNYSNMTGSDADQTDNYQLVDEEIVSLSDWVGSSTEGDEDTYPTGNVATGVTILGVQETIIAQKDDASAKYMRALTRVASTDYPGTSYSLGTGWAAIFEIWELNPNISTAWTSTTYNGAEFGQEVRDS